MEPSYSRRPVAVAHLSSQQRTHSTISRSPSSQEVAVNGQRTTATGAPREETTPNPAETRSVAGSTTRRLASSDGKNLKSQDFGIRTEQERTGFDCAARVCTRG